MSPKEKIFIGYNGSDDDVRGSLVAFDAETGKEAWRFWTVPGDPAKGFESKALEMAAKTWTGKKWWRVGGGAVWDPSLTIPQPVFCFSARPGQPLAKARTAPKTLPAGTNSFRDASLR